LPAWKKLISEENCLKSHSHKVFIFFVYFIYAANALTE